MQFSSEVQQYYRRLLLARSETIHITFTPEEVALNQELGRLRQAQHNPTHRDAERLFADPATEHILGVRGEHILHKAAPKFFHLDRRLLPGGDGGSDTRPEILPVNAKARAVWGYGILERVNRVMAGKVAAYVLSIAPPDEEDKGYIIGWCTREELMATEPRTYRLTPSYCLDPDSPVIRPFASLISMMERTSCRK